MESACQYNIQRVTSLEAPREFSLKEMETEKTARQNVSRKGSEAGARGSAEDRFTIPSWKIHTAHVP